MLTSLIRRIKLKGILPPACVVVGLFCLAGCGWFDGRREPEYRIVKRFERGINKLDMDILRDVLSEDEYRNVSRVRSMRERGMRAKFSITPFKIRKEPVRTMVRARGRVVFRSKDSRNINDNDMLFTLQEEQGRLIITKIDRLKSGQAMPPVIGRYFNSDVSLSVSIWRGPVFSTREYLEKTPRKRPIGIPVDHAWFVQPRDATSPVEAIVEAKTLGVPGLGFDQDLTDDDMALLGTFQELKYLRLGNVAVDSLVHIKNLTALEFLEFRSMDTGLAHLSGLTNLKILVFNDTVTDKGGAHLTKLTALEHLRIREQSDSAMAYLKEMPQLQTLVVLGKSFNISDAGFAYLAHLPQLRCLGIRRSTVTDTGLEVLANLRNLEMLNLDGSYEITGAGLRHIARLPTLRNVTLTDCRKLSDEALAHLGTLNSLEQLSLIGCNRLTDTGMAYLTNNSRLTRLSMDCHNITDTGMAYLTNNSRLTRLSMNCHNITDVGMAHLSRLTNLRYLSLSSCHNITDAGMAHLARLTNLKELRMMSGTHVTDAGISHLENLSKLEILSLWYFRQVTDVSEKRLKEAIQGIRVSVIGRR